jgi:3-oxoadipate enol-lactonase
MPVIQAQGARLHYRLEGPADAPVVVLSCSLGTTLAMWDGQIDALTKRFRVLRYDMRGHGASTVSTVPVDLACLGRDVMSLLDSVQTASAHFVGLSLGGMIGLWLAEHEPERVDALVLSNTAAVIGVPQSWNARIEAVSTGGMEAIVEGVLERWFTPGYREREPERVQRFRSMLLGTKPSGYVSACAAVRDADLREGAAGVRASTLVITGALDVATPPSGGQWLAERIAGARLVQLEAAHLSNVEAESAWSETVVGFLSQPERPHG